MNKTLTALRGVQVGHSTHLDKLTGCTFIRFDRPYTVAYKGYGGNIGSYNTEILRSGQTKYQSNGIFISGGSLTGLMSGGELTDCLRNDRYGAPLGMNIYNPLISGAIIFDLGLFVEPFDKNYAVEAYRNLSVEPVSSGNVCAGTGASVGKFRWLEMGSKSGAMKGGVGNARVDLGNGITVTALSVVNAMGNITLPDETILAGNRDETSDFKKYEEVQEFVTGPSGNTTISVVGINVNLQGREHYERVAHLASHGQVRAINPVHTSQDGDSIFVFSTEQINNPLNDMGQYFLNSSDDIYFITDLIGQAAAKAVQESIYDACRSAESIPYEKGWQGIIPASRDYPMTS